MTHRTTQEPTNHRMSGRSIGVALIAALAGPLGLTAQDGLNVYISADMEGVVGVVTSGVEPIAPLHDCTFDVTKKSLGLFDDRVIARDHDHRHPEVARDGRVYTRLRHVDAIQPHGRKVRAGHRMGSYTPSVRRARVVPEEDGDVERLVDPLHHHKRARP